MTSSSSFPNSAASTIYPFPGDVVITNSRTKQLQPFGFQFKCTLAACTVGGIAGAIIVILGTLNFFGPVGSIEFAASIAGGGTAVVIAICVIGMVVLNGKSIAAKQETDARRTQSRLARQTSEKPYSELGIQAIDFALQKLDEHPEVKPKEWSSTNTRKPVNPDIARLVTLLWQVCGEAFTQAVKKYPENPWAHEEVIQAADACMKISYAIGCLTLEDLPAFTEKLAQDTGETRSYRKALIKQDSYLCFTFFYCSDVYCWMTGERYWSVSPQHTQLIYPEAEVVKAHAQSFYQEGTVQFYWRTLYNDYCTRVKLHAGRNPLRDGRHVEAISKDRGVEALMKILDAHLSWRR
jgi:hypothetical protein